MTATRGASQVSDDERHEKILALIKSQVKVIMEEAVTRKFVHEESSQVLSICGTVETCLLDGLRRRVAGFLRSNKLASLFTKVGKSLPDVAKLVGKIEEMESSYDKTPNGTGSDDGRQVGSSTTNSSSYRKFLWVREALTSKLLDKIVAYLVANNNKYYEKSSIMADPVRGEILASLLVGPSALDFTRMKTHDSYWSDPPAGELLQRHRLHSRHSRSTSPNRQLAINCSAIHNHSSNDPPDRTSSFRDYVESLHQNPTRTLLYGKNNVVVQPEDIGPVPGYLSLHQEGSRLMIKWTPNQMMNVKDGDGTPGKHGSKHDAPTSNGVGAIKGSDDEKGNSSSPLKRSGKSSLFRRVDPEQRSPSFYWKFALAVDVREVVYLHCHQKAEKVGTLVLVGQDGVQWPPIRFPAGGHLLAFLSCLETGLLPHGYLDPPLWSQKGKGKVFPHLYRKSSRRSESSSENEEPTDFVFRVNSSSDSSYVVSSRSTDSNGVEFDLMNSIFTLPALLNKAFPAPATANGGIKSKLSRIGRKNLSSTIPRSVVLHNESLMSSSDVYVQPACLCSKCTARRAYGLSGIHRKRRRKSDSRATEQEAPPSHTVTWESGDTFVPHLDMYSWDQNHPRHYDDPSNETNHITSRSGSSLRLLCDTMRRQIISRAFYGWLAHCRHLTTVRTHLSCLVNAKMYSRTSPTDANGGVNDVTWKELAPDGKLTSMEELMRHVYFGGVEKQLRGTVWPYLLNHYPTGCDEAERREIDSKALANYENVMFEWQSAEVVAKQREQELASMNFSKSDASHSSSSSADMSVGRFLKKQSSVLSDVFISDSSAAVPADIPNDTLEIINEAPNGAPPGDGASAAIVNSKTKATNSESSHDPRSSASTVESAARGHSISLKSFSAEDVISEESEFHTTSFIRSNGATGDEKSAGDRSAPHLNQSPPYSDQLLIWLELNLHRIDKDVQRCDRNHWYFAQESNLNKLRNVISCYVWRHLDVGYLQGMCDIAAPLFVVMDDESLVYDCYEKLMERMSKNFPHSNTVMDQHFANMRSLTQILDSELFEIMYKNGDYTHFFFCYRWFLLDLKRELSYENDLFAVWERIWAAQVCSSKHFVLFYSLAMIKTYRDIILENDMDFSDIIKFFNEMAENHDAMQVMSLAESLVTKVQLMIQK